MAYACGIVVNPALRVPLEVNFVDDDDCAVDLYALNGDVAAQGALDCRQHGRSSSLPAELTGYPRVHTLPGVADILRKQKGYGTALYAGAALSAHLIHDGSLRRPPRLVGDDADGVCSATDTRKAAADAWWLRALTQWGLSREERVCGEGPEESVAVDESRAGPRARRAAEDLARELVEGDLKEMPEWQFSFTWKGERCFTADILPYRKVAEAGLVLAEGTGEEAPRTAFFAVKPERLAALYPRPSLPVLRAVNVGHMASWPRGEAFGAMDRLVAMLRAAGGDAADEASMVDRFNAGADPAAAYPGPGGERKENRARGRPPPGPAARRHLADALRAVRAQRAALGWGALRGAP